MASQFDDSDFVDRDYQSGQSSYASTSRRGAPATGVVAQPPTRQELETRVSEAQQKLAELKRAQEELERERSALEEARRRRVEFQTGREEMLQHLTRGVALLEQAEFNARRDAEQMGKTLAGLRDSLSVVQNIRDETWTQENCNVELSKALAGIENARMEWNSARLKWTLLNGQPLDGPQTSNATPIQAILQGTSFWQLCKLGIAFTWPLALVGLVSLAIILAFRGR
jgi:hypothetical protein